MPEPATSLLVHLWAYGPLGIAFGLLVIFHVWKDRQWSADRLKYEQRIADESEARIADAKDMTQLAIKLQTGALDTINGMRAIFEELKKQRRL
jgi:hypothetical protein